MLVLSRHKSESIIIGENISVMVVEICPHKVRLGVVAPKDIPVHREEVHKAIARDGGLNRYGQTVIPGDLSGIRPDLLAAALVRRVGAGEARTLIDGVDNTGKELEGPTHA